METFYEITSLPGQAPIFWHYVAISIKQDWKHFCAMTEIESCFLYIKSNIWLQPRLGIKSGPRQYNHWAKMVHILTQLSEIDYNLHMIL